MNHIIDGTHGTHEISMCTFDHTQEHVCFHGGRKSKVEGRKSKVKKNKPMKNIIPLTAFLLMFMVCMGQQIHRAEYFIDSDPGFGLATPIAIENPDHLLALHFLVYTHELDQGFHTLVVRACDDMGRWSHAIQQKFYVFEAQSVTVAKIDKAEYFIDSDPGFGLATPIDVASPEFLLSLSFQVNTSTLPQGFHTINTRSRDEMGRWSLACKQLFYVTKTIPPGESNITGIEYFVDEDPGFGNGTFVSIALPASNVTADFIVNTDGLSDGDHILYIRSKDVMNRWSQTLAHAFSMINTGINSREVVSWLNMYPNPNDGQFNIELANMYQDFLTLKIHDLNGRTVLSKELYSIKTPVTVTLPPGIYMLSIETGEQYYTQKLIINR
jgi:hypothetical protein